MIGGLGGPCVSVGNRVFEFGVGYGVGFEVVGYGVMVMVGEYVGFGVVPPCASVGNGVVGFEVVGYGVVGHKGI